MAEDAPQWLQEAFAAQSRQLAELAAQQASSMATLANRISQIEERPTTQDENLQIPTYTPAPTPELADIVRRPKPRLPNPDKFDGKDKALYPQFEGLLRAKLQIDGPAIGGEYEQVWYVFGRLSDEAAGRIYPWISFAQAAGKLTVVELLNQMKIAFSDPRQRQKALGQLNRTKQGTRSLSEFLNEFNRLILEAEGWGWDDVIKKGYLKAAISIKLMTAMVGIKEEESYDDYCSQLRMTNDQLAEIAEISSRRTNWEKKGSEPREQTTPTTLTTQDKMDWEPAAPNVVAARTREPRWAEPSEIERRRKEGLCLRCGRGGHMVRDCRTKLETPKTVRVAVTKTTPKKDEETPSDSSESGKE
jgi:hypothetical protein